MGYSLQKEAEATQGGRKEPGRKACHPGEIRDQGGGGRWLLRRECPSLAQQRRCLKGEEGEAGGRPEPSGRHQGAATEPRGSLSLVHPGPVHPGPSGAWCPELRWVLPFLSFRGLAACWGLGVQILPFFRPPCLPPPHALHVSEVPGMQGDPQVVAHMGRGVEQG